jgi:hypothetical protein
LRTAKWQIPARYRSAQREPKSLILYVVDTDGKLARSFMPVIDAILRGPDALFRLLRSYLEQVWITEADQVLFVAENPLKNSFERYGNRCFYP